MRRTPRGGRLLNPRPLILWVPIRLGLISLYYLPYARRQAVSRNLGGYMTTYSASIFDAYRLYNFVFCKFPSVQLCQLVRYECTDDIRNSAVLFFTFRIMFSTNPRLLFRFRSRFFFIRSFPCLLFLNLNFHPGIVRNTTSK